jgi:CheY-like chemotaxis protein
MASSPLTHAIVVVVKGSADEPVQLIEFVLRDAGAHVIVRASAEEAFESCAQLLPDAILADVTLGGTRSGVWLLTCIRATPAFRNVAIIAVADRDVHVAAEFDEVIRKPVDPETLLNAVTRAVERHRRRPSG